ncbi:mitotic-spindle organizing protein 2B-like isoform X1 [Buteo buteo]|uniref:mitotic-spindle organizing protein 2B-like isoform X1 n=1 Tax=Buteo buteo TaxID=30397 RepID=UPI003EBC9332
MLEAAAAAGMAAAAAAMAEARLRRKQLLSAEEAELFELAQAAGSGLDPEVFRVLLDLLRMNVAPLAVFQVLKSMCAGQRLPPGPEAGPPAAPASLPADTRVLCVQWERVADWPNDLAMSMWLCPLEKLVAFGQAAVQEETLCADLFPEGRNKTSSAVSGTQVLAERSSREGSAQRMPRQPSASRLQKAGASGKNSGGGNST